MSFLHNLDSIINTEAVVAPRQELINFARLLNNSVREDNPVEWFAKQLAEEKLSWITPCGKRGISNEDKNDDKYENQTGDYIVFQIGNHEPHVIGHVRSQVYFQGLRQLGTHVVNNAFDFIGHPHDVFAAAL